jgi:uncharacterized protein (DUF2141 family)
MIRLSTLLALFTVSTAYAASDVSVEISGIANADAQIIVSVYDSKKSWLKDPVLTEVATLSDEIIDGTATIVVSLPPGDYAFHIYHDKDLNGKMKTNFIGIPKEPTGVSNDAKGKFGPPKFKDAMLSIGSEPLTIPIKLTEI